MFQADLREKVFWQIRNGWDIAKFCATNVALELQLGFSRNLSLFKHAFSRQVS
jgi:ribosome-associated toxin RatA of RatAB toxin-antitoxin module